MVEDSPQQLMHDRRQRFNRYVAPEIPVLLRVAQRLTTQQADAEDLVQDTLVRAYRAIGSFDGAHPRAWLLTIMRRAESNRHRARRPDLLEPHHMAGLSDANPDTPEELVVGRAFDDAVDDALHALPAIHRVVVQLVDIEGLSYAEAADILGVPSGTIMSRLHRARTTVRHQLARRGLAPKQRRWL